MHHTRWREEEEAVFCGGLHHRSSKQGPLKRTPVTNMAAATGCSEGLQACTTHGGSGYCQHPSKCITPATKYGVNYKKHTEKEMK